MHAKHILLAYCLAAFAASAAVPVRFDADVETPRTHQEAAYRGETLDIEARLTLRGAPFAVADGADAAMCWQTNGMGDAWWTAPASVTTGGVVTATWSPSNDVGAASYRVFLRVAGPGGASYRANMLLRLLGSPGETPNALPLPVKVLDFARISYTNEPWSAASGLTTNDVRSIVDEETALAPCFSNWGSFFTEDDGGYAMWGGAPFWDAASGQWMCPLSYSPNYGIEWRDEIIATGVADMEVTNLIVTVYKPSLGTFTMYSARHRLPGWIIGGNADKPLASAADVAVASAETRRWTASTYGDTNSWIAIEGKTLGFYSKTNSPSGPTTNTLWESSSALGGELAGVANRATNNTTRIAALERRPDLTSWGDFAPDGSPNPDPEAMVYLNKALTLMGSGFSWATSGSYACLCQSGAVAFQVETNGEIRIGTDVTTNYFGIVQDGTATVGCMTHGISVADGVAYLLYAYAGGAFPVIWWSPDLIDWQEVLPVWIDNGDGTATAAVPTAELHHGFFKGTTTRKLGAIFRSNVPAHFPFGVYGNLNADPVKYDSVITIESGGRTYRIPAQEVP